MAKFPCPVCGDPSGFLFWIEEDPPEGCPFDQEWMEGRPASIKSVDQCQPQMKRARQRAEWRKVAPDCFDANGNILPGKLYEVLERWGKAAPGQELAI